MGEPVVRARTETIGNMVVYSILVEDTVVYCHRVPIPSTRESYSVRQQASRDQERFLIRLATAQDPLATATTIVPADRRP